MTPRMLTLTLGLCLLVLTGAVAATVHWSSGGWSTASNAEPNPRLATPPQTVPEATTFDELHQSSLRLFTSTPSFGYGRMAVFDRPLGEQPGPWVKDGATDTLPADASVTSDDVQRLTRFSTAMFVSREIQVTDFNARVTDLRQVLDKLPWHVKRIDLIGLISDEEPRVYISGYLPRMKSTDWLPHRGATPTENAALEALRAGENLHAVGTDKRLQLFGAVRAADQCVKCHKVDTGTLLGAFSYKLER